VLDLIGDLALAGRRILGRVVAERAGHAMHTALVSRLLADRSAWEMVTWPQLEVRRRPERAVRLEPIQV
jgi:UDP-3-O-[3-hydroxymyristoyl] N-acetylglucosamine deacetylase